MGHEVPPDLLEIVDALLPGAPLNRALLAADGNIHHVVLLPGVAAVRISRRPSAAEALPRRTELLRAIGSAGLPFAVPEPLTPVTAFDGRVAVAVSWLDGTALPEGEGDPEQIGELLRALREVPLTPVLRRALSASQEQTPTRGWAGILAEDVIPRLPPRWRDEGRRRLDNAVALEPVPDALVHGDLAGSNVHWGPDGKLIGVLDWDLALPFDPAIDAACMAWHGWDTIRNAVDHETYRRARAWDQTFGIGHLIAVLPGKTLSNVDSYVDHIVPWLERNAHGDQGRLARP
ncbi:phosphotransferase family protein [Actinacidiphila glaucinigra]|uniref:phosphotransferase family protein n=1 Tax=Actinacidiphila glaucinigra TaxID=235986 RepID=UPI002DD8ADA6|nr:aminoglycoside phosphotransferase family protein [Actinacidiphila glaucinigra]WSD57907.1 aminoglycoside phosphotransferase family protein [Actinacidiphila glaucinigra]